MVTGKKIKIIYILSILLLFSTIAYAVTDPNMNNNNISININVIKTREFTIGFISIDNLTRKDRKFEEYSNNALRFINSTFPIADNKLSSTVYKNGYYVIDTNKLSLKNVLQALQRSVYTNSKNSHLFERIVAVAPQRWFENNYNLIERYGLSMITNVSKYNISTKTVISEERYYSTPAHELANTYGFCDEYSRGAYNYQLKEYGCRNKEVESCLDDDFGCPAETYPPLNPWDGYGTGILSNFMGISTEYDIWISDETYSELLEEFSHSTPINVSNRILVSGFSNKSSNLIEFDNFYLLGTGFAENTTEHNMGEYSIILLNNISNVLVNLTFDLSYDKLYENASDENISYFVYVLEFPENTSKIIITENGVTKDEVNVSPNAPTVDLTYPDSSEIFKDPFNITWNANDPDGDTLYYAISLSYDNGSSYSTIELDYEDTYYTIDPNNFLCGSNYKAEVMVTDGVRTIKEYSLLHLKIVELSIKVDCDISKRNLLLGETYEA